MANFRPASARRIAVEIRQAQCAVDMALLHMTRLTSSMLEVSAESELPAAAGQKALENMAESVRTLVAGRSRMVSAHRHMARMKNESNLDVVDLGCGGDNPLVSARDRRMRVVA